jgi:hypothetical protein
MPKYKLQENIKTTKDKQRENNVQIQTAERGKDKQRENNAQIQAAGGHKNNQGQTTRE